MSHGEDLSHTEDLRRIAAQEQRLVFDRFSHEVAWALGGWLRQAGLERGGVLVVDVSLHRQQVLRLAVGPATPDHDDWIRRKRNTTLHFARSSYAIGLNLAQQGTTLEAKSGLAHRDYATHGGSVPLVVAGAGCIGALTVSGLPQREDHALAMAALAHVQGRDISDITLA
ncbi:heme-degrading domain-containing protein [Azospirillum sp. B4]|uniref:heme-degrading domain-containing protein n=1 Tax=Azospirillum sp. B4 TaxID=95605 RepID=UPI0003453D50|nr:heme-degrading domain-containing protein [Azospirillum sp. B4]